MPQLKVGLDRLKALGPEYRVGIVLCVFRDDCKKREVRAKVVCATRSNLFAERRCVRNWRKRDRRPLRNEQWCAPGTSVSFPGDGEIVEGPPLDVEAIRELEERGEMDPGQIDPFEDITYMGHGGFTTNRCKISIDKARKTFRKHRGKWNPIVPMPPTQSARMSPRRQRGGSPQAALCQVASPVCKPPPPECFVENAADPAQCVARKCKNLDGETIDPEVSADGDRIADGLELALATLPINNVLYSICSSDSDGDGVADERDFVQSGPAGALLASDAATRGIQVTPIISRIRHGDACCGSVDIDENEPWWGDPILTEDSFLGTGNYTPDGFGGGGFLSFHRLMWSDHEDQPPTTMVGPFRPVNVRNVKLAEDSLSWARTFQPNPAPNPKPEIGSSNAKFKGMALGGPSISLALLPLDHDDDDDTFAEHNNDVYAPTEPEIEYRGGNDVNLVPKYSTWDLLFLLIGAPGDVTTTTNVVTSSINNLGEMDGGCVPGYGIEICLNLEVQMPGAGILGINPCSLGIPALTWFDPTVELIKDLPPQVRCPS